MFGMSVATTAAAWLIALTLVFGSLASGVFCVLKGKWFVGILALPLAATGIPVVVACRLARPDSWWARHRYDSTTSARSLARWHPRSRRRLALQILAAVMLLVVIAAESTVVP